MLQGAIGEDSSSFNPKILLGEGPNVSITEPRPLINRQE